MAVGTIEEHADLSTNSSHMLEIFSLLRYEPVDLRRASIPRIHKSLDATRTEIVHSLSNSLDLLFRYGCRGIEFEGHSEEKVPTIFKQVLLVIMSIAETSGSVCDSTVFVDACLLDYAHGLISDAAC